jgi:hypothetical protein
MLSLYIFIHCRNAVKSQFDVPACREILYLMNTFLVPGKAYYEQYTIFLHLMNLDLVNNT